MIRFELNEQKAVEALVWIATQQPGITFYYIVKVLFFADKQHLNRYGRPILGDRYIAMEHGPVPSTVYDMLGLDRFLDLKLRRRVSDSLIIDDIRVVAAPGRQPDLSVFSKSDIECLSHSLSIYGHMSFSSLKRITHEEGAYVNASANGEMNYLDMIEKDNPHREAIENHLKDWSRRLSL